MKIQNKLDKDFAKTIISIVTIARESVLHNKINSFLFKSPDEIIQNIKSDEEYSVKAEAIVNSTINKFASKPGFKGCYNLAAEIFEQIANKHPYPDGNKRTGMFSAVLITEIFTDKSFTWSKHSSDWYTDLPIKIVEQHNKISSKEQVKEIAQWLKSEVDSDDLVLKELAQEQIIHRGIFYAKKNLLNNQFKKIMNNLKYK